jgi:drug/metabolite transporter (DMT)-like permease
MTAALLALLAGAAFGSLTVAVRFGLDRSTDPQLGTLAVALVSVLVAGILAAPSVARGGIDINTLWPFMAVGLLAPGASQLFLTLAVRDAGPSRAAILMGLSPLLSVLIALTLLGEPFRPLLVVGTGLIVFGGVFIARERKRPERFRMIGAGLALLCAGLFATRDNLLRAAATDTRPPPLVASAATLLAAAAFVSVYVLIQRRKRLAGLPRVVRPFAPAGLVLALAYGVLLEAFDRGRVTIVAPLTATGSLWAVLLTAIVIGRAEMIGRRTILSGLLVVAGGILIAAHP